MKNTSPESDLTLVALRYAAGELDSVESADFEQRLATDLDAQLALVQAVQVASAVFSPAMRPTVSVRPVHKQPVEKSRRGAAWLAVLSSGAVAAAMLLMLQQASDTETSGHAISENSAAGATLSGWAAVQLEDPQLLTADDPALLGLDEDPPTEEDIPDWLFAAVEVSDVAPRSVPADAPPTDPLESIDEDT